MLVVTKRALYLALAGSIVVAAGCGGSGGDSSTPTVAAPPTLQQRTDAATSTAANNTACTSITPFYWEIGDANGMLASGSGGDNSAAPPTSTAAMPIASASKWIFSTYVVEKQSGVLSASDIDFLNFQSGYVNLSACSSLATVAGCLSETGSLGGATTNGDHISTADGKFFYNGGHMQVLANNIGLGPDHNGALATDIESVVGASVAIAYVNPQLAGGVDTTPAGYAQFLRNVLGGQHSHMLNLLGSNAVCTHTNSTDCPTALFSPVNQSGPGPGNDVSDEQWHYSLGHWVEDDPILGDGAFSSPGRFGFYPWIDKSKTYYGLLARYDTVNVGNPDPKKASYITSVFCGRLIRQAWELGQTQ
ncbi:MAG TPA: hypothetical protein VEF92_08660 [Burkholderiales bacterium]|nr:hypothetical protein [Burkholderiales bacterium]